MDGPNKSELFMIRVRQPVECILYCLLHMELVKSKQMYKSTPASAFSHYGPPQKLQVQELTPLAMSYNHDMAVAVKHTLNMACPNGNKD